MGLDNPIHIAFLVVILLLVFGARRLPEIGRSLGSGMREFKDAISGEAKHQTLSQTAQPPPAQQPQPPVAQPVASASAATPQAPAEQPDESTFGR
jgi:sec-independent protein translocase protein TatA